MKHAVIVAHPRTSGFVQTMADAYCRGVTGLGHEALRRDLYTMHFDPCLREEEIPSGSGVAAAPDIVAEREIVKDCSVFVLVYPLWLNAPPAMLLGYLQRVFGLGFAYGRKLGGNVPLLQGRKLLSITSSGAPMAWVKESGAWDAMRRVFDEHFAAVCGLEVLDHIHFGGIVPGMRADAVERCGHDVEAAVARHFGAPN